MTHSNSTTESMYLTMRDGVQLAVDVHLPDGSDSQQFPTILHQTRYFRAVKMRALARWIPLPQAMDSGWDMRQRFLAEGYAWVDICVRGSGASYGSRPCPWSEDEIADGLEVLNWITSQAWSDGQVGLTGISYAGTSAELLTAEGHSAVRAVSPRFSCFDVYTDVAFPGGVHLHWFTEAWGRFNELLDGNRLGAALALNVRLSARGAGDLGGKHALLRGLVDNPVAEALVSAVVNAISSGVKPADSQGGRSAIKAAAQDHANNYDVHAGALNLVCRDDLGVSATLPSETIDYFSPHTRIARLRDTGVPVLNYSGWYDGAYAHAAIKRHMNLPAEQSRLILGPWNHGGNQNISPFTDENKAAYNHNEELLGFFDQHMRGRSTQSASPVRYFTLGAERWQSAAQWPPKNSVYKRFHFDSSHQLAEQVGTVAGTDAYGVNLKTTTGHRARWNSLLSIKAPIGYNDAGALCANALCYTAPPLGHAVELTGHPIVSIKLSSEQADFDLFAYVIDLAPNGSATYVTEGMLRSIHRATSQKGAAYQSVGPARTFARNEMTPVIPGEVCHLEFDLLPISYEFAAGHAIRVALTGADASHFTPSFDRTPTLEVHWGVNGSWIDLPLVKQN